MSSRWTLTGGAALVGFHTLHRVTRDLDLFFRGLETLGRVPDEARALLAAGGLSAAAVQTAPGFARLRVSDGMEAVLVDLVADPTVPVARAHEAEWQGVTIRVDSAQEILASKLCALLGRAEVRDLCDVQVLVGAGQDLEEAVLNAPARDGGFSPLTLARVLRGLPVRRLALASGWADKEAASLERFRDKLVERLLAMARPEA
jgi:hypothetical protein